MCLTELLDEAAGRWPLRPALVDGDITVSYAELKEEISDWAVRLRSLGVTSGARIGISLPNGIAYVAITFALWRAGAIVVPIPGECAETEAATIASTLGLAGIVKAGGDGVVVRDGIFFRTCKGNENPLTPALPPIEGGVHKEGAPNLECGGKSDATPLSAGDQAGNDGGSRSERAVPSNLPAQSKDRMNIAFIRFTSGTSNDRKGVVLCHETVRDRVLAANKVLKIGPEDIVMWCLPMSHHFLVTIVLYLSHGATIVLARHVLPGRFLELTTRHRGTVLYAAPFHYGLLARDTSGVPLSSVRLAISTTCALSKEIASGFRERYGLPVIQALGIIEAGLVCVNVDDPIGRWNSVGRPLPDFAVDILNPDFDGCGEVRVAGPGIFDAYASPWTPGEQLMPDGWFGTGDIGRLDAEGYLYLLSRRTAVINLAGRKVFPEEIEAVLDRHPAVRESRVYGVGHPHLGEIIEVEVALKGKATPDDLREFCRAHIGPDKVPSRIRVVERVARTDVTGKLRRSPLQPTA